MEETLKNIMEETKIETIGQRMLWLVLYALLILMVIFSIMANKDKGEAGYDKCLQEKCKRSQEHCQKFREINNCCLGAGGKPLVEDNQIKCHFIT